MVSEGVLRAVAGAKRWLEVSPWETRCGRSMRQVYWERMEVIGRWVVDALRWRLNKLVLQADKLNWAQGWVQHRAQEEGERL